MSVFSRLLSDLGRRVFVTARGTAPEDVRALLDRGQIDEAAQALENLPFDLPDREFVNLVLAGEIAFRRHRDDEAERLFDQALTLRPGAPEAHYGLSTIRLARGEAETALRHAQFAARGLNAARMHAQIGLCTLELGNVDAASRSFKLAVKLDPHDAPSWCNLGISYYGSGRPKRARECFLRALEIRPGLESARQNLDALASHMAAIGREVIEDDTDQRSMEQIASDIAAWEAKCLDSPDDPNVAVHLATLYEESGELEMGYDVLNAYLARRPDEALVCSALGKMYVDALEFRKAEPLVRSAMESLPEDPELLRAKAEILINQRQMLAATELLERSCALRPDLNAKGRLATALTGVCRYEEALALVEDLRINERAWSPTLLTVEVDALNGLGRHQDALAALGRALAERPFMPGYRLLRGVINLSLENFAEGWDDYSYRNLAITDHLRVLPYSAWAGEPLEGKSIVIAAEQGLGDQVMFASCLPDILAQRPARVVVEATHRVAPTLARSFPQCEVIATGQDRHLEWLKAVGPVDYFTMIGDLPRRFRRRREDFPAHKGYLVPDANRSRHWGDQLATLESGRRLRIGATWRGGTELTRSMLRTLEVTDLADLMRSKDATWVCLQYGDVKQDLARARQAGMEMAHWPESIADLDEFAALVSNLDLVITVCNTTVHYAGALNVPTWVMAPKYPEWRYGVSQQTLPWYPATRVYRQEVAGEWQPLIERIGTLLAGFEPEQG
jgi:tetratricopeptide (TPR) repeat protein